MEFDSVIGGISTLVTADVPSGQSQGTGFFYQDPGSERLAEGNDWPNHLWVVTNRHVVLPEIEGHETVPDSFTFRLRHLDNGKPEWDPITLNQHELLSRLKLHPDPSVDVAIVDVLDLVHERVMNRGDYLKWYGVSKKQLPKEKDLSVEVTDDALVVGYPRGFYDEFNVFPIVKSGIIASRWGAFFNGMPFFLIDAKLFPGSSGSIVVSKPKDVNMGVEEDDLWFSTEKDFAFLGIFSGEPLQEHTPIELDDITIIRKSGFNVGVVWYADLVEATVKSGVPFSEEGSGQA